MLPDGTYDAIVVDADERDGVVHLELTILAGEHKSEVVSLQARGLKEEPALLLGIPATIMVVDGRPRVRLEP